MEIIKMSYIAIFLFSNCMGYFYCGHILEKSFDHKDGQCIIMFGDFHQKNHPIYDKQYNDLNRLLQLCKEKKGKLIVEDLSSKNNEGRGVCCSYVMNNNKSMLAKLANKARAMSIDVDNIEYRYCRVVSLAPLLHNPDSNPYSFNSTKNIPIFALYKEIIDQIEKIKKYNDEQRLKAFYFSTLKTVNKDLSDLLLDQYHTKKEFSVASYCYQYWNKKNYYTFLEKLCIFDSALLDINILHSIITSKNKSLILVIAGGSHIEQVKDILVNLGYTLQFSFPQNSSFRPIDLKKAIHFSQYY